MPRKIILVLLLGMVLNTVSPAAVFGQGYVLDQPATGQKVCLEPGDMLEITLSSNPSTGYCWTGAPEDNTVLTQEDHWMEERATNLVGAPGTEHWLYKAVGPGEGLIDLWYSRPWESRMPEQRISIEVSVAAETVTGYSGSVWVDSREVPLGDKAVQKGGRIMVDLEQLASVLGAQSTAEGTQVRLNRGERSIIIDRDRGNIQVDGVNQQLPVYRVGDQVMVPVRVVAESLGYQVEWRAADQAIVIKG